MALPEKPKSGGHELTNTAGFDNWWTCPNCYADHYDCARDTTIECGCGATLELTIDYDPVCRATCIDPEGLN